MWRHNTERSWVSKDERASRKVRSSCRQMPRAHMDRQGTDIGMPLEREDSEERARGGPSTFWRRQLQKAEDKDPDR